MTKIKLGIENGITLNNVRFYIHENNHTNKIEYWKQWYSDNGYPLSFQYKNEKGFYNSINKIKLNK